MYVGVKDLPIRDMFFFFADVFETTPRTALGKHPSLRLNPTSKRTHLLGATVYFTYTDQGVSPKRRDCSPTAYTARTKCLLPTP